MKQAFRVFARRPRSESTITAVSLDSRALRTGHVARPGAPIVILLLFFSVSVDVIRFQFTIIIILITMNSRFAPRRASV